MCTAHLDAMEIELNEKKAKGTDFKFKSLGKLEEISSDHNYGLAFEGKYIHDYKSWIVDLESFAQKLTKLPNNHLSPKFSPNSKYFASLNDKYHIELFDIKNAEWRLPIYQGKAFGSASGYPDLRFITDDLLSISEREHSRSQRGITNLRLSLCTIDEKDPKEFNGYDSFFHTRYANHKVVRLPEIPAGAYWGALVLKKLLLINKEKQLQLLDYEGKVVQEFDLGDNFYNTCKAISSRSEENVSWISWKEVHTLDLKSGKMNTPIQHQDNVKAIGYDENDLLVSLTEKAMHFWNSESGKSVHMEHLNTSEAYNSWGKLYDHTDMSFNQHSIAFRAKRLYDLEGFKAEIPKELKDLVKEKKNGQNKN
ncbi:hypothetical protein HYX58_01085 [Candidatus Dependentiae bacterium]|nr:hypothetical protein [Candidatus Dependentiae bacterium]